MATRRAPRLPVFDAPVIVARRDATTGSYRVDGPDGYPVFSASHAWLAACRGYVVAGEIIDREECARAVQLHKHGHLTA